MTQTDRFVRGLEAFARTFADQLDAAIGLQGGPQQLRAAGKLLLISLALMPFTYLATALPALIFGALAAIGGLRTLHGVLKGRARRGL